MTHDIFRDGTSSPASSSTNARDGTPTVDGRPIGVGLIGYGGASKVFHAPLITTTPGLVLRAVSSSDATKVHADYPDVPVESSPEALIARDDIDLVVIPTPNTTHFPLARAALEHNKHVVVDKPFTLNLQEAETLAALAQSKGRLLTVFHNRRWDADFLAIRQLIDNGTFGQINHFESTFDYFRPEPKDRWRERPGDGSGLWNDIGAHLVDQALQLFGVPEAVYLDSAILRQGGLTDDYFTAILRYPDKRAILRINASAGLPVPRFIVQGSAASYRKYGLDPQENALKAGKKPGVGAEWGQEPTAGELKRHGAGTDALEAIAPPNGNYPAFYTAVAHSLQQGAPAAGLVRIEEALAVMAILDLGRQSAAARAEVPFSYAWSPKPTDPSSNRANDAADKNTPDATDHHGSASSTGDAL